MGLLIFYSLIGGVFSLAGGLLLLWKYTWIQRLITPLLSFAAGAFLGAALLDILPEVLEKTSRPQPFLVALLVGFVVWFILERLIMTYFFQHRHRQETHSDHTESLPLLLILGDSLHNFLDGIVIALAYVANPALGLTTTLAVAAHEIPQEIGDFSILLYRGWSKRKVVLINVLQSLLTVPGAILGYYLGQAFAPQLLYLLAAAAGIFIYLAASDIIPEVHHQAGHKQFFPVVLPLLLSLTLVGLLTF
ncbi:MAG: ZIP family metal transporter [Patescibacteria group bacterium]|nr:ZIP family metal transporter [Candidatus Beckwithbacteria bacterium]MDZ4228959.1 ZIP family metal transporter [Patescibacteria group bacterium]